MTALNLKMIKHLLTLAAIAAFASTNAHAALGWTLEKCKQSFGPIVSDEGVQGSWHHHVFKHSGYVILVSIEQDGTVGRVIYNKDNFTSPELAGLMKANLPDGAAWIQPHKEPDAFYATAIKDGVAVAYLMVKGTPPLILFCTVQNEKEAEANGAAEAAKM